MRKHTLALHCRAFFCALINAKSDKQKGLSDNSINTFIYESAIEVIADKRARLLWVCGFCCRELLIEAD